MGTFLLLEKCGSWFLEVGLQKIVLSEFGSGNNLQQLPCKTWLWIWCMQKTNVQVKSMVIGGHGFCWGTLHSETLLARIQLSCHSFRWDLQQTYSHLDAHLILCFAALGDLLNARNDAMYMFFWNTQFLLESWFSKSVGTLFPRHRKVLCMHLEPPICHIICNLCFVVSFDFLDNLL